MRLDQSMNKKTAIIFTRLEPISNNYKKTNLYTTFAELTRFLKIN